MSWMARCKAIEGRCFSRWNDSRSTVKVGIKAELEAASDSGEGAGEDKSRYAEMVRVDKKVPSLV